MNFGCNINFEQIWMKNISLDGFNIAKSAFQMDFRMGFIILFWTNTTSDLSYYSVPNIAFSKERAIKKHTAFDSVFLRKRYIKLVSKLDVMLF